MLYQASSLSLANYLR